MNRRKLLATLPLPLLQDPLRKIAEKSLNPYEYAIFRVLNEIELSKEYQPKLFKVCYPAGKKFVLFCFRYVLNNGDGNEYGLDIPVQRPSQRTPIDMGKIYVMMGYESTDNRKIEIWGV